VGKSIGFSSADGGFENLPHRVCIHDCGRTYGNHRDRIAIPAWCGTHLYSFDTLQIGACPIDLRFPILRRLRERDGATQIFTSESAEDRRKSSVLTNQASGVKLLATRDC
jgi:hypothetical protein